MAIRDREFTRLEGLKNQRITVENNLPSRTEGQNGDISIRSVKNKGIFLFVKVNNTWHSTKLQKGLDET